MLKFAFPDGNEKQYSLSGFTLVSVGVQTSYIDPEPEPPTLNVPPFSIRLQQVVLLQAGFVLWLKLLLNIENRSETRGESRLMVLIPDFCCRKFP